MKKIIIKLGNILLIPTCILAICSFLFDKELVNFPFITEIRFVILISALLLVFSGILQLLDKRSKKNK